MLFNSMAYAIFLPIVFVLYWIVPHRFRWPLLLIASYYFYMSWNPKYVILIFLTTIVSYFAALIVEKTDNVETKRLVLGIALLICLGILFVFKYYNFCFESLARVLALISIPFHPTTLKLILPVGISFYTFQTLSYVIDVYKGDVKAEKNFSAYATFVSFFPQLVAGPIERTKNLLPQIRAEHTFDYDQAILGAKLMVIGYYKKLVIADVVGKYVDLVYSDVHSYSGFDLALIIFFFTMQIYCDFSGYSDIAIGTAKLLGINLMTNFRSPYFSASVKEFWSRWHISLSTWFRDYVYIPLGGNRCCIIRHYFNLMVTFLLSGLWHGASWNYVFWGAIHGVAQVIENVCQAFIKPRKDKKLGHCISVFAVFLFCNIAWVFFRADSVSEGFYVISHAFSGLTNVSQYFRSELNLDAGSLMLVLGTIAILAVFDYFNYNDKAIMMIQKWKKPLQWILYVFIGLLIVFLSEKGVAAEFVYFQF